MALAAYSSSSMGEEDFDRLARRRTASRPGRRWRPQRRWHASMSSMPNGNLCSAEPCRHRRRRLSQRCDLCGQSEPLLLPSGGLPRHRSRCHRAAGALSAAVRQRADLATGQIGSDHSSRSCLHLSLQLANRAAA